MKYTLLFEQSAPSVTLEERRAAEEVILAFRKSKDAVDLCKYILGEYTNFHYDCLSENITHALFAPG